MNPDLRIGVVLFQLGGPDSLEAVRPFLYNLFCDPDIIDFPGAFLARKALAKFISAMRSGKVAEHYKEIGGKSPIRDLTNAQATALEKELRMHLDARVFVAMRYWRPFTEEAIAQLKQERFDKIILLPLYPQYSKATTGSSLNEWKRKSAQMEFSNVPTETVLFFHDHPQYIEAIVDNINLALKRFSGIDPAEIDLVFSAHGVPVSFIKAGDPYQQHIEETVRLTLAMGRWKSPHMLCYQSKVGPIEWLKPSLLDALRDLASRKRSHCLIIPVAFVTEHIETLHEINIEAREEASRLGITRFEMMPALNDSPKFIGCLADLVMKNV